MFQTVHKNNAIAIDSEWWKNLDDQWKMAFNEAFLNKGSTLQNPSSSELKAINDTKVLRFVGPDDMYSNTSIKLTNLSGVANLKNLEILIVNHHSILDLTPLTSHFKLKSLFVMGNEIESLKGLENLRYLTELYASGNKIKDLKHLKKLTNLEKLIIQNNQISSLKGIGKSHRINLNLFYCLPNPNLEIKAVLDFERRIKIKCQKA